MTWTTLATTTRKIHYSVSSHVDRYRTADAQWPPLCFDILCTTLLSMNCETSSAWKEFRYENMLIEIIMLFLVGVSGRWELPLSAKLYENLLPIHSTMFSIYQVPNQCSHRAGSALQRHLPTGEPSLCCCLPDPISSRVQHLCKCWSWSIQTDPTGEMCIENSLIYSCQTCRVSLWSLTVSPLICISIWRLFCANLACFL